MYVSARADYALRALAALAAEGRPMTVDEIAQAEGLPPRYLGVVLGQLRRAGIVANPRGTSPGYRFLRNPDTVTAADAVRAVDGLLAEVPETRPVSSGRPGEASPLQDLWAAVQTSVHDALDAITIAELARGRDFTAPG
jgi:Rrf2 family protein